MKYSETPSIKPTAHIGVRFEIGQNNSTKDIQS